MGGPEGRKGGTLVNNSHGQQFDEYAQAHLTLEAVPTARQAFEKLVHKRSAYVVYEQYPGMALARTLVLVVPCRYCSHRSPVKGCTWPFRVIQPATSHSCAQHWPGKWPRSWAAPCRCSC